MGRINAILTLIALVVGAGILGVPYVVSRAGFWNGMLQLLLLGIATTIINLYIAEIVVSTKGQHHLITLAEKYAGKNAKRIVLIAFIIGQYGAMLAYIIGINRILITLFGEAGQAISLMVFISMAGLLFLRLHVITQAESILTILMVILMAFLSIILIPNIKITNLTMIDESPLKSFGVIIFAYMGFTVIPDIIKELKRKKQIVKVILDAYTIIILLYALFTYSFVGVHGKAVAKIAVESLTGWLLVSGGILILLLLITSYVGVGLAMKNMLHVDLKTKKKTAWAMTIIIPFLLLFLTNPDFISVIGIAGTISGGVVGIIMCLTLLKARKKGDRTPEFTVPGGATLAYVIIAFLIIGVILELI